MLLHGLTATPRQFAELAPMIHARGWNVVVPRLPRHGYENRLTRALADLQAAELIAGVKVAIARARELGGPLTVAGFSLGGLLAAYAAQCETVDRVVCISPFFGVPWLSKGLNFFGTTALGIVPRDIFLWWDPVRRQHYGGDGYPRYPLGAVRTAFELRDAVFEAASVRAPATCNVTMLANHKDTTCSRGMIRELAGRWRANGASVDDFTLPDIGPSHDFMTPVPSERSEAVRERVYPVVVDVITR